MIPSLLLPPSLPHYLVTPLSLCLFTNISLSLQDASMWKDALRICKDYLPTSHEQLQDEYERTMLKDATKFVRS